MTRSTRFCRHDKRSRAARDQTKDWAQTARQTTSRAAPQREEQDNACRGPASPALPALPAATACWSESEGTLAPWLLQAGSRHRQVCTGLRELPQVIPVSLFLTLPSVDSRHQTTVIFNLFCFVFVCSSMTDNCISQ